MAAKLVTATQRPITPQNEREAGEHDGPSADEENIFQTRGPAEVLTEFGERREGESPEAYADHRPLERSAAADVTVHQSIKVLAAHAGTHGIHDERGRVWITVSRKGSVSVVALEDMSNMSIPLNAHPSPIRRR